MRRAVSIILLLMFLGLASGAMEFMHNLRHAREDAAAARTQDDRQKHDSPAPVHDESNCFVHAQLHLPTLSVAWVPLLVFLGVYVAFLTEIAQPLVSHRAFFRLDCRGPPAC